MSTPLIYEVTLDIEAASATDFDAWLKSHVQAMLALPGFRDARILKPEGSDSQVARRVVQYTLGSRAELDTYLAEHAPRMREDGVKRFGDRMKASRRVLDLEAPAAGVLALPGLVLPPAGPRCRNCGTPLSGKFCMECGQKNHTYVAPLWHVLQEFAAHHFGFDTKFFHSIVPLLFRPGFLTTEYCLGHEERYVKPFRLYLFCSIVFFFLAAMFWPQMSDMALDASKGSGLGPHVMTAAEKQERRAEIQRALDAVSAEPVGTPGRQFSINVLQEELTGVDAPPAAVTAPAAASVLVVTGAGKLNLKPHAQAVAVGKPDADERFTQAFLKVKNNPDEFKKKLVQNLPKMMFVLMPLIALFLKLYYIRSKRFLTEHFVFTLHFHAMAFVVMLLVMLADSAGTHFAWALPLKVHANTVAGWYITIYLFLAMRFFYRQGWWMTALKFCMLFISYFIALTLTFTLGVVLTAAEI